MPHRFPLHALVALALLVGLAAPALAQPVVDGNVTDADYTTIGTKPNGNAGFGPDFDVQTIRYYSDTDSGVLYLAVEGRIQSGSGNAIGLWLGFSELTGAGAGATLTAGGLPQHFGFTDRPFQADFDVDFGFVLNRGGSSDTFADVVRYAGGVSSGFLATLSADGTASTNAGGFGAGTVTLAFNAGGGAGQGFEIAIPFAQLGITAPDASSTLEAFAYIVSGDGYFSDVAVGGAIDAGNVGFRPNFATNLRAADNSGANPGGPVGTAPFHTTAAPLGPPTPTAFAFESPTAGSSYRPGSWLKPIWDTTPDGAQGDVTVTLRKGGVDIETLYAGPNLYRPDFRDARYLIPTDVAGGTDYTVYVELDSDPSVNAESGAFTIVAGAVTVTNPDGSLAWTAGEATAVTFTLDNIASPSRTRVYLRRRGQAGSTLLANELGADGSVDITFPVDTPMASDYFILVRVNNAQGKYTGKSATFMISSPVERTPTPQPTHFVVRGEAQAEGVASPVRESYLLVATAGLTGELGVFAGDVLVGSALVQGATTEVVVIGSDLADGEALSLRSFSDGVEQAVETTETLTFADGDETAVTLKGGATVLSSASLAVSAFPNPASSTATIRVSSPSAVAVYDVLGRVVADLGTVETDVRWDASGASPGVYVIRATTPTGTTSVRVTVAR